ncbi:MAG: ABC transporter permease subunit [Oscillospiraceae bacterium]|jgi:phosphonate transport system permease protein|nr:ABC transporter permease subunit [Oscillospiraceae bacterium]
MDGTKIRISRTRDKAKTFLTIIALAGVFVFSSSYLKLDIGKFISRLANAGNVLNRMMNVDFSDIASVLSAMLSSVSIAVAALFMGFLLSIILSFLAASNIAPSKILAGGIKGFVAVIRAVPALVWILMVVASLGFGSTSGMIGIIFPTMGYLTKSFIASIEDLGYNTIEAMKTTGAGWLSIVTKGLLPGLISPFSSWTAIRLEGNIAESINLGMVGVAGIGSHLMKAIGKYNYGAITVIILVIFITMFIIENLTNKLKKSL